MTMNDQQLQTLAEAYARATTHTRCMRMGECKDCQVRYCDYKSRVEAYSQGAKQAIAEANNQN